MTGHCEYCKRELVDSDLIIQVRQWEEQNEVGAPGSFKGWVHLRHLNEIPIIGGI